MATDNEPKKKHPGGRPPEPMTKAQQDAVLAAIATQGRSNTRICLELEVNVNTFYNLLDSDAEFLKKYQLAKQAQADALFDEILDIADDASSDAYYNSKGDPIIDFEVVNRSKLRVESRKWMVGRLNPKKYGDKQEVTVLDGGKSEAQKAWEQNKKDLGLDKAKKKKKK